MHFRHLSVPIPDTGDSTKTVNALARAVLHAVGDALGYDLRKANLPLVFHFPDKGFSFADWRKTIDRDIAASARALVRHGSLVVVLEVVLVPFFGGRIFAGGVAQTLTPDQIKSLDVVREIPYAHEEIKRMLAHLRVSLSNVVSSYLVRFPVLYDSYTREGDLWIVSDGRLRFVFSVPPAEGIYVTHATAEVPDA